MELRREVVFTKLTGFLVFKNPKCKTCYQIIENSIFIYSVLPKTGKTWQHFLVSKRLRKEYRKQEAMQAVLPSPLDTMAGHTGGSWLCFG